MEKSTLPEPSLEAQQHFREAITACLAIAQERLVEEVQLLAAHLTTTVADQVVQLHEDATGEVKFDTHSTFYSDSSVILPEAPEHIELPPKSPQSGAKPRMLPPLLSPTASQTSLQSENPALKSCLSKGPKRCKKVPSCEFAVPREDSPLSESRADADDPEHTRVLTLGSDDHEHMRAAAVVQMSPQEACPEGLRKVADTDDSYALLDGTDADATENNSKINACREDSDKSGQPRQDAPALDASNKGSADDEAHRSRPSFESGETRIEFDETLSCGEQRGGRRSSSKGSCGTTATTATATKVVLQSTWVEAKPSVSRKLRMLQSRTSGCQTELILRRQPSQISFHPGTDTNSEDLFPRKPGLMQRLILQPGHPFCIVWDILTAFAIIHDVIIIPLLAFEIEENILLDVLEVITSLVWAGDLFLSFFRGVADNEEGIIEMRPKRIARLYLKSWFVLDFGVVFLDFLQLCMSGSTEFAGVILLVRMMRILRLARIVKILKVSERLTIFRGRFSEILASSEKKAAVLSILKLLLIMVVVNHFAACGWYGIGSLGTEGRHWIIKNLDERDASFTYRYGTSFHWAVTQFTPASMEVYPTNSLERIYNICVIFGGLMMFSTVISAMTQTQLYIQKISDSEKKERKAVQRFMAGNSVSIELSSSILLFLRRHKEGHKRHLTEQDVSAFSSLPENMIIRLRFEVFSPTLLGHAVLALLSDADMHSMNMICHNAASELCVLRSEDVFQVCVRATHMYFVTSGRLAYFLGFEANPDEIAERGRWISEAILWIEWEHSGRLSGESRCNTLAQLNVIQFLRFAAQSVYARKLRSHARLYAREAQKDIDLLTDLWGTPEKTRSMIGKDDNLRQSALSMKNGKMWMLFAPALPLAFMGWKAYVQDRKKTSRQRWCCLRRRRQRYFSEDSASDGDASSWPPSARSSNCFTPQSDVKLMFHADQATIQDASLVGAVDDEPGTSSKPSGLNSGDDSGLLGG